jgi:hypothetical protein
MTDLEQRYGVVVAKVFFAAIEGAKVAERFDGIREGAKPVQPARRLGDGLARDVGLIQQREINAARLIGLAIGRE